MTVEIAERDMTKSGVTYVDLAALDFDVSLLDQETTKEELSHFGRNYRNKYGKKGEKDDLGLVVGRFQPPHPGHLFEILTALEVADHVVIGIGSANADINTWSKKADMANPLPAEDRQFLLTHFLEKIGEQRGENLLNRISFIAIDDVGDNEKWRNMVLDQVDTVEKGPLDVVIANDGWVKKIFHEFGVHTYAVPFFEREKGKRYEGSVIRKLLRKGNPPIFAARGVHKIRRPGA